MRAASWSPKRREAWWVREERSWDPSFPRNSGCPFLSAPAPPPASPRSPSLWKFWRRGKEAKGSRQFFSLSDSRFALAFAKEPRQGVISHPPPFLMFQNQKEGTHRKCSGNCPTRDPTEFQGCGPPPNEPFVAEKGREGTLDGTSWVRRDHHQHPFQQIQLRSWTAFYSLLLSFS